MWTRLFDEGKLKENLKARYNDDKAYELFVSDLKALGVNYKYDQTEDTKEYVRDILLRGFTENCERHFRIETEKNIPLLSEQARRVVFLLRREGTINKAEELNDINAAVWTPYKIVFGVALTEEEKQQIRTELSKLRVVDLDWLSTRKRSEEYWHFPSYSRPVVTDIERYGVRLPRVYLLYELLE